MAQPVERKFVVFPRGHVRDAVILASMRDSLRTLVNPETGVLFTEDEIGRATQKGSRFWIQAEAIDLYGQASQARALFFADQVRPDRASSAYLRNFHARMWLGENAALPASGGSGSVSAPATVGSIFVGSTTVPDPVAAVARDPAGKRYQVLVTVGTPSSGTAALVMQAIDVGDDTNPAPGTVLEWVANQPLGAEPQALVSGQFTGGAPAESDADLLKRVLDRIRRRQGAGNGAHFRGWSRGASAAVENAFVYATALHAGSTLVVPTQKRGQAVGPLARIPSIGTLNAVTGFVVPPNSPVVPARAFVMVLPPVPQPSDLGIKLSMYKGTGGGWYDAIPWPGHSLGFPAVQITALTSQVLFDVETSVALPGGATLLTDVDAPQLMVWDKDSSRFERLFVQQVQDMGANVKRVTLSQAPDKTLALADRISPYTDRLDVIAQAVEQHFDELGPGEVVNLDTDIRGSRAFRFPRPSEEFPQVVGLAVVTRIIDSLGGTVPSGELVFITVGAPSLPTDPTIGPSMVTLGHLNIYPST